ncbi:hypothetical protein [Bergeyella sp. RCAD1439]|uniref:hypothetical protein n=1 Tax=Bergeyella anatis TaxID=3113737 RepID=UPI002E1753DC|nr:hypothetical protein [Bergeyella sp. RCAD1439]
MKKTTSFAVFALLGFGALAFGQSDQYNGRMGINTTQPDATLEVRATPDNPDYMDGFIAPRLEGDKLHGKTYTLAQRGAIVYVTKAEASPSGQTANVTEEGYYYFDGSSWQKLSRKAYTDSETVKVSGTSFQRTALTGDVTANLNSNETKVTKIQGFAVSSSAPEKGQLLVWNGTAWTPTGGLRRASGGTVTLTDTDNGGYVYVNNTSATNVNIPSTLPVGFSCVIVQANTGQVTVSTNSASARGKKTRARYSAIGIIKDTPTSVTVTGDAVN